ncbi:zinc finger BED domain-containing protein DAYSLEEPER-like [Silene latifolia]|uniref:zinc finger BED domain-containing protein DAYSLEEPER-like n=1 Tax=Silene latifolia TaxID=37657 RepID=UPI003D789BA5
MAVVLDPHSNLTVVELTLTDLYGKEKGEELASNVKIFAYSLFDEYRAMYSYPQSGPINNDQHQDHEDVRLGGTMNYVQSFKERAKRLKGLGGNVRSEFERYLNEVLGEDEEGLEVLTWWRLNTHRYPVVSRMARDILVTPLSIVASESTFSAGSQHLDSFRSSLTSEMVQTLICSQDLLQARERETTREQETNASVELDDHGLTQELEDLQKEYNQVLKNDIIYVA